MAADIGGLAIKNILASKGNFAGISVRQGQLVMCTTT
jgi:hypothetical protein